MRVHEKVYMDQQGVQMTPLARSSTPFGRRKEQFNSQSNLSYKVDGILLWSEIPHDLNRIVSLRGANFVWRLTRLVYK